MSIFKVSESPTLQFDVCYMEVKYHLKQKKANHFTFLTILAKLK